MANRLANSTSPYLQQHRENPVDWHEWGPDAFAAARERGVPVLLSVGYAACHWCHVMAHESFEDPGTAAQMNEHFVNIKVDREERPDVDAVYMAATQAMTGHGGWPMTVFLTPDGRPFYAGTYFPPRPAHGSPAFREVLAAVADAWVGTRTDVELAAGRISAAISQHAAPTSGAAPTAADLDAAVAALASEEDRVHGGLGPAPKFPPSMVLEFLLRHAAAAVDPGSAPAAGIADRTLRAMAHSGMYDQLAGGFARYAVDPAWVVPHFEKMLYDNALLARVYLHWWRLTGEPAGARIAAETCDWMLAALRTAQGGLASSLDADTPVRDERGAVHGVEGHTYVWTPAQLAAVLGPDDGAWAAGLLRVTPRGTFERGTSTLQLARDVWAEPGERDRWRSARDRLLAERERRPQPALDDKVVAAWNGLAVAALAETGALLDRPDLVEAAETVADLLVAVHLRVEPGTGRARLARASRDGVPGAAAGVAEDYGDVAEGLIALHTVTGEPAWLEIAAGLLDTALQRFGDSEGGFFDTPDDGADPALASLRRPQDPTDNAYPSGTSALAGALLSLAALTGSQRHRAAAEAALGTAAALAARAPRAVGWGLAVGEAVLAGPPEIAVVGADGDSRRAALHQVALRSSIPGTVVSAGAPDADGVPLLAGRPLVAGGAAAYVCRGFVCDAPTVDPEALAAALHIR